MQQRPWLELIAKAKSTVAVTLCDGQLEEVSKNADNNNMTEREVVTALIYLYCMSNNQLVMIIQQKLLGMKTDRDEEQDKNIEGFHHLAARLSLTTVYCPPKKKYLK